MLITLLEVFDILLMTALMGFLFNDSFGVQDRRKYQGMDIPSTHRFTWPGFWFAAAVIGPSIILHELSHKFTALALGYSATFHAFYADAFTLILGIFAIVGKLVGWSFLFFVPGFVSISDVEGYGNIAIIAFAGPAIHLLFWLGCTIVLKTRKRLRQRTYHALVVAQKVNLFLFILNMLPIPGIDGWSVYSGLYHVLF